MAIDDQFAQWAAAFIRGFRESGTGLPDHSPHITPGIQYTGVTPAAGELLRAVDAGGVPAFVTSQLKLIAAENGIEVASHSTPNEIVQAIRQKATVGDSASSAPTE